MSIDNTKLYERGWHATGLGTTFISASTLVQTYDFIGDQGPKVNKKDPHDGMQFNIVEAHTVEGVAIQLEVTLQWQHKRDPKVILNLLYVEYECTTLLFFFRGCKSRFG